MTKHCEACGQLMPRRKTKSGLQEPYGKWKRRRNCSMACRYRGEDAPKPRIIRPCVQCQQPTKNAKYCSKRCFGDAHMATEGTPETLDHRARGRARARYGLTQCATCATKDKLQRHHVDLNPRNNAPDNIMILCHRCHSRLHGVIREMERHFQQGFLPTGNS